MFELRKSVESGEAPRILDDFEDAWMIKEFPAVHAVFYASTYPDGEPRMPGSISSWRCPEGVTVKLTDKDLDRAWQATAASFLECLQLLEDWLQRGKAPNAPSARSLLGKKPKK